MIIISCNVNGIRVAYKKGLIDWVKRQNADFVCLQEIKAKEEQLENDIFDLLGYHTFINSANKKGYSGVLTFCKQKPLSVKTKLSLKRFDQEGRMLILEYKNFTLINLYLPHGGRGKENLEYKLECYKKLFDLVKNLRNKKIILAGDFNIAHKPVDLARPEQNKENIMFTSEERRQIDKLVGLGFKDSFRQINKGGGSYTWWPYAYNARKRNLGWRIDYIFILGKIKIKNAKIYPDIIVSDHCPISAEVKL